jgi:AraC-like DNA-binding protein
MALALTARGVERFLRESEALPAGHYREFAPPEDLREVVACTWVSAVSKQAMSIIPDGCSDILIFGDSAPQVVGPDTHARWAELPKGAVITGIRFRPGAVRSVFGCAANQLLDESARLSDLRATPLAFTDMLARADTLRARHEALEHWVRNALNAITPNDRAVLAACRALCHDAHLPIASVAERSGWNARMLHRQFIAACGYGPKHLQRVMRVQTALRAAHRGAPFDRLPQIAAAAGFSDQAHMTREFRDLTGFTPASYLARSTPEVGTWLEAGAD